VRIWTARMWARSNAQSGVVAPVTWFPSCVRELSPARYSRVSRSVHGRFTA
jgi:hypothetical protein